MAQSAKTENEEVKKLQAAKVQSEKLTAALQEDVKRTKQQMEVLKRESLKLKSENSENLVRLFIESLYREFVRKKWSNYKHVSLFR